MSNLTAAYIAGFVDGEGYISLKKDIHSGNGNTYYVPVVAIANTNKEIIEWIKSEFGGWIYIRKFPSDRNCKDAYHWKLTGLGLQPFLSTIYPHLRIKKEQCSLVLRKIELQNKNNLPYRDISHINKDRLTKQSINREYRVDMKDEYERIYLRLRELNKRGRDVQGERLSETNSKEYATV
jgi:hypothetical protein